MPSLRTFWEPACDTTGVVDSKRPLREGARWILVRLLFDADSPLVEFPVDFGGADATVFDPCSQAHIYTMATRRRLANKH
jgi:hypothetical protein